MKPLPTFHPQIWFPREDWEEFCRWLEQEIRTLAPSLRDWSAPWIEADVEDITVNIEPGTPWTHNGERIMRLYFAVYPDGTLARHPNVGVWVSDMWPHHDALCGFIEKLLPEKFVTVERSEGAGPARWFWRDLPLGSFRSGDAFDVEGFARAIGEAFESLASLLSDLPRRGFSPPEALGSSAARRTVQGNIRVMVRRD